MNNSTPIDLSWLPQGWGSILGPITTKPKKKLNRPSSRNKYRHKLRKGLTYHFHAEIEGTPEQATRYARTLKKQGYRYITEHGVTTHRIFTNGLGYK